MVACRNSDYLRHGAGQSRQSLTRAFLTLVHGSNAAHHTREVVPPSAAITRFIRQVIHTPAFQVVSKKGYPVQKDTQFLLQIIDTTQANRHSIKNILTEVVHSIKKEDVNTLYSLNNQYQHYAACLTKSLYLLYPHGQKLNCSPAIAKTKPTLLNHLRKNILKI